jgi:peptide/nickel transport system permease protein
MGGVALSDPALGDTLIARRRMPRAITRALPAKVAGGVIAVLVLVALLAPLIAPHDPNAINPLESLAGPSSSHPLGQDSAGRDLLSRLMFGARLSLLGPAAVVLLSLAVGIPLGLIAGWRGGWLDGLLSRSCDAILAFPPLLLAIVITAAFGADFKTAIIAIAITYVPLMIRVVRGLVLVERTKTYVDALRCQGFSTARITARHVLPNISRSIAAQGTLNFGYALIDLAGLAFLGLGVQPPTADWGAMLSDGRQSLLTNSSECVYAALAIAVTVVSFNIVGDALTNWAERRR